jgi:hypothetical protein
MDRINNIAIEEAIRVIDHKASFDDNVSKVSNYLDVSYQDAEAIVKGIIFGKAFIECLNGLKK